MKIKSKVLTDNEIERLESYGIHANHVVSIAPERMVQVTGTTTFRTEYWRVFYMAEK